MRHFVNVLYGKTDRFHILKKSEITTPLIGYYDTPDTKPFEPFAKPQECIFSCYENWLKGESICISEENVDSIGCVGAGYWLCGVDSMPRNDVAQFLAVQEGLTYGIMLGAIRRLSKGMLAPLIAHIGADITIFSILVFILISIH